MKELLLATSYSLTSCFFCYLLLLLSLYSHFHQYWKAVSRWFLYLCRL